MALFRRKKEQDILPDEVKDYYKAEQRERMGMAWLVAGGGFLITVAIVVGLFFAGRWAFTTFFANDTTSETSEIEENGEEDRSEFPSATDATDEATSDSGREDESQQEQEDEVEESDADRPSERATTDSAELPRTGPIAE